MNNRDLTPSNIFSFIRLLTKLHDNLFCYDVFFILNFISDIQK